MDRRSFINKSAISALGLGIASSNLRGKLNSLEFKKNDFELSADILEKKLSGLKSVHPSLHFDAKKLKILGESAKGTHQHYAEALYKWLADNSNWDPPHITGIDGEEVQLEECAAFLTNAALAYCLSQKKEYLSLSRRWAMTMCKLPEEAVRNYGIGIYVAGLARAYDWLYHDLSNVERNTLKNTISDILGRVYAGTLPDASVPMWWSKAYMHHDHWIAAGGFGEASLALLADVKDSAKYASYAKINFDIIFSWLSDDGAWHEGAADWCYTMAPLLWFYGAWESRLGEDLHHKKWIENTAFYRLYHWLPDNSYIYLDDSFRSGRYSTSGAASCHLLRRLASLFGNGYAQWLAERDEEFDLTPSPKGVYQAPYENLSITGEPKEYPNPLSQCVSWNFLWYDPSVKALSPIDLPLSKHFNNQDIVVMRTGWDNNETVVSFTCAPLVGHLCADRVRKGEEIVSNFYSHAHLDFNSFTLFANNQYFIIPAGYARRTGRFQNVVTVNGSDFIANPASNVRITTFINNDRFAYAVGNATDIFQKDPEVEKYQRHVLLFENKCLIIFDELYLKQPMSRSRGYNHFTWTVHNDPNTHSPFISGKQVEWQSLGNTEKPPLLMKVLEPQEFTWETGVLKSSEGKDMMEALRISRSEWYSDKMQVITLWSWNEKEFADKASLIRSDEYIGILLDKTKGVYFNLNKNVPTGFPMEDFISKEILFLGFDPSVPNSYVWIRDGVILE